MDFNWPDISQNQLFNASLGVLGAGFDNRSNPFTAAQQGLVYGKQIDQSDKEQERLDDEAERRKRLENAWAGMFGVGQAPAPGAANMSPAPPVGPADGLRLPTAPAVGPQMASGAPDMSGMGGPVMAPQGLQGTAGGNSMLAGIPPQMHGLLSALGPETGARYLFDAMNRQPPERRIIKGADGRNYYADTQEPVLPNVKPSGPEPTSIQRNLEAAGYEPGTPEYARKLQEYLFKPNSETNVTVGGGKYGTIPTGYMLQEGEGGARLVPIPGGPAAREIEEAARAAEEQGGVQLQTQAGKAETMLDATSSIREIMDGASTPVTGTTSRPFAIHSGTPAGQVRSYVGTLKSGVALGAIQRLKEASATGATGFGAMNEAELQLLIDDIGALDPDTTDPEIFLKTVDRIERRYKRVAEDIKENVSPERIEELGLEPLLAAMDGNEQAQIPPPNERQIGTFYQTPRGRALWTGEGWQLEEDTPGSGQ